jgi:hypothetical protein
MTPSTLLLGLVQTWSGAKFISERQCQQHSFQAHHKLFWAQIEHGRWHSINVMGPTSCNQVKLHAAHQAKTGLTCPLVKSVVLSDLSNYGPGQAGPGVPPFPKYNRVIIMTRPKVLAHPAEVCT